MRLFSLPNLAAHEVEAIDLVAPPTVSRPPFASKTEYRAWCQSRDTQHAFVSAVEGLIPGLRVSASNPPKKLHGLILEYDAKVQGIPDLSAARIVPMWKVTTFSGNMRLVFPFEKPLAVDNADLAREFHKVAYKNLKAKKLGPGWEPEESAKIGQYFEIGEWSPVGGSPVPMAVLYAWLAEAVTKVRWDSKGITIPFEKLQARGQEMFPGRWPGGWPGFVSGARGVRFWDPAGDADSVVVTETGCVCFTGDQAFLSWAEIFGADWVRDQRGGIIGEAISNMWWEEGTTRYWRRYDSGEIGPMCTLTDVKLHLQVMGLKDERAKGEELSQVEQAIYACQLTRRAEHVVPLIYRPNDIVYHNRRRYLNVSRTRPMPPVPDPRSWGDGFPWVAKYLDKLWDRDQWVRYISWIAHFYQQALSGAPSTGLALFIAGDHSIGKNFSSNAILGQLFGGHGDASKYITGEDAFNKNLMDCPIWTCHDTRRASDNSNAQMAFTQQLKRVIADRELIARAMHKEGVDVPWNGRIVVTLNRDPESLRMLPDLEQTILNKVLLLRANDPKVGEFPSDEEVARELPFFGAYLRDFEIPAEIREARFGVRAWHHPELLEAAHAESATTSALEVINIWRREHFTGCDPTATEWIGSATELLRLMLSLPGVEGIARGQFRNGTSLGRSLNKLIGQNVGWVRKHHGGRRFYLIERMKDDE